MTRTHTVYFDDDTLADVRLAYQRLLEDWGARRTYMSDGVARAGDARLGALGCALSLLAEPVAEGLY